MICNNYFVLIIKYQLLSIHILFLNKLLRYTERDLAKVYAYFYASSFVDTQ